jgi:hypothetical protein
MVDFFQMTHTNGIYVRISSETVARRRRWAYWSRLIWAMSLAVAEYDLDSDKRLLAVFEQQRDALKEEYWSV